MLGSVAIQLVLGVLFGHVYDMRIFMATGYLVGTGQNPYIPQDLSAIFQNPTFQSITTLGYPPPWTLVLGGIYRIVYSTVPNFLVYNAAIKLPLIAANIALAYLAAATLRRLGAEATLANKARTFLFFNPLLLFGSVAWGQIDSVVAALSLAALLLLDSGKIKTSAILLALAVSIKPTALPLLILPFFYLGLRAGRRLLAYYAVLVLGGLIFCAGPFVIFGWDPSPILRNWNAVFVVGGGLTPMAAVELFQKEYRLPGNLWLVGLVWIPALAIVSFGLRRGTVDTRDLLKKATALILVFFLTRAWLSEPNVILLLPFVLILTLTGDIDRRALQAIWILPLIFAVFNVAVPQLFFPSMPHIMDVLLAAMEKIKPIRLVIKVIIVIPWEIAGWWIVMRCLRRTPSPSAAVLA